MFDKGNVPTAVIAINDFTAAGVMRSIIEHGFRIPQDISLVSYDNTYMAELLMPKLTSVDYNYEEFGRKLIETAIATIEGKDCEILQAVMPVLVCRESSGMAPKVG
jgi:DNA-binding LacI/PurR family transcriptional regulator